MKVPSICDRLIEACKYEYKTRHLIDGRIVQCDQRISIVAGYLTDEVSGLSPFTFMHRDDVRWVIVALRQSELTGCWMFFFSSLSILTVIFCFHSFPPPCSVVAITALAPIPKSARVQSVRSLAAPTVWFVLFLIRCSVLGLSVRHNDKQKGTK